jgi:hypothetical protein
MLTLRLLMVVLLVASAAWADVIPTGRYGGTPALGACGTSPALTNAFDSGGTITIGTGVVTSCVLNFSSAGAFWTNTPQCIVHSRSGTILAFVSSLTSATLTIGLSASLPGGTVSYLCW